MEHRTLTVTGAVHEGARVSLRAEAGVITELGPAVQAQPGDEIVDAGGRTLLPPLLNGHTHASMTLFRGHGDDLPLMRWLEETVWPVEAKLTHEDVYWGTRLACLEMVASGTTRFWDMYWQPGAAAEAVRDAGMRATLGGPLVDLGGTVEALKESALEALDAIAAVDAPVDAALAPHAVYTVSEGSLRWVAEVATERDLPVHIHCSETEKEVADCVEAHGLRPVAYLDRLGLLGPKTLLAHGVWLDRSEVDLVAERGATIVANPVANMKLSVGRIFDYPSARQAGIPVGLGTDGAGSNNSMDMFDDTKTFALTQKHLAGDPAALPAEEAWAVAVGRRAPLLGATPLEAGQPADFLLLRRDAPELSFGELAAGLVYSSTGAVVDTVVVGGRVLMRDRVIDGADEVLERARERARGLGLVVAATDV